MAQYLNLPNGYSVEIKEGETREAALARAISKYPDIFGFGQAAAAAAQQPESGFVPALKSGVSSLKSDIAALAGRTGIMDQAAAEKYIKEQEEYQKRTFKPTETFGEAPITKTLELLGGSVPYMAAPIAAGAIAPAGALALGAAGAASAAQFTGSNLSRQMQEGKTLGETDVTAAALASVPQAALDALSLKMLPGIRRIFGQAGKEISTDAARAIAQQSVKEVAKDYALATGKAMGTEGLTEVGQQALERMQAGLALTDEKAREEYFDSLVGGAVLGGVLSPAGRYVERRGQAKKEEAAGLEAALKQREADAKQREVELAQQATPEGRLAFVQDYEARQSRFQELNDMAKPGKDATPLQQAEYAEIKKEKSALGKSLFQDSAEYKKALPIVQQLREQRRVDALTPEEWQMEQLGLAPGLQTPSAAPAPLSAADELFDLYTQGSPASASKTAPIPPVNQYVAQQLNLASQSLYLKPEAADYAAYLMQNPEMAAQITTETPMPGLSRAERNAVTGMIELQLQAQAKEALQPRVEDLAGQVPKKAVGKRKAPDYEAYLQDLETIDFDRREGQTAADIASMEKLRVPTDATVQGEMFGQSAQQTVLGEAPKTRRELLSDLRVARVAGDRNAAEAIINSLRAVDKRDEADAARVAGSQQKFVLNGEQREALSAQGYSEEQIDELEAKAQKSLGQAMGAGQTPLSTAIQQAASESRADAFSEVVDLVNRFNKGAAKQEQLDAAKERLISGLLMDIRQSRQEPLTEEETRDITRNANELLRELTERFGDTRSLSQKGKDLFVPAQTKTGEFRTDEVPGKGYPTVESRAPGRQTFGSPFAAAQSIREGLEELRTRAITSTQVPGYTRTFTPREVSVDAAEAQLSRELAKDPQTHSPEQRRLLEAIGDNVRMMLRPETRQDVSSWLYDLARDPATVPADKTQTIRDALQTVEQAKLSDQDQLGLPLGPGKKLRQEAPQVQNKPTPVQAGSFSQVSFAPEYEAVTSPVFNSYAELKQYLASDALQEMRSALGLGRPTIARLEQRLQPFMAKLNTAKAKVAELSRRAQAIETNKRKQLEELKAMSASDMAAETRAINEARRTVEELRKRMVELEAPLRKELEPLLKEFDTAQKQFDKAVAAEEALTAAMLRNNQLFGDRELTAIQKLHNVQQRMKNARSKLHKEFQEEFGNDPRNLARTMREFKESGKQGAFNEQLATAHKELYDVFFDTRKDDVAIQQYLKTAAKLDAQIQEQAGKIDALGEKLLNAGLALETVRNSQLDAAENRDELIDTRQQAQEAQQALRDLEAKQKERLNALSQLETELGLTRTEIPHRISETTTVAEVLRASTDSEKALIRQLDEAEAELNEAAAPVKSLRAFDRQRNATRAKKPETAAQTQERDAQRQRLLEAIGRDPASFDGERVSFEKRRALIEELGTAEETRGELEALIAAADEAIPYVQQQIAEAEKALKGIDKEIAQVEAANKKRPRSFQAKLEQQSAMVALGPLREARERLAKSLQPYPPNSRPKDRTVHSLVEDLAAYEREKATAQSNLVTLEERKADLEALFSDDPEVQKARTQAIDKRIAKVEKNIENQKASLKEKRVKASTLDSRKRELRKSFKELQRLMAQRSAKFGITRKALADVGRPETAAAEEGERLDARKVGPVVRPTRTAGNIRTGVAATTEERKLSTRSKITQGGKTKTETSKQAQVAGNVAAEERAAQQPEKTATELAVEELQQQQQILAAKERLEASIRMQLADLDIRLDALRRSQRPNVLLIRDLEAQKSVLQRDLVAARTDVEREGALAAEAQKIVDTQSTVGNVLSGSTLFQVATEINNSPRVAVDPQKSASALMAGIATTSKTPLNRAVAERLKGLLGVTEVRIAKDLRNDQGEAVYGGAAVDGSRITLDADSGLNEQTILHEGVHAATERVLRAPEDILTKNQRNAKRELEALYKAYAADTAAPNDNAKESISEFVADALSDPAVQMYMQGKKWTLKNMWASFKNSILKMIGVDTPSTMLEATLAAADMLMLTVPRPTARTTESLSRKKPQYASPEWASAGEDIGKVVAQQRTWGDKIKANATGLAFETQLVDRFAAFERLRKYMPEQMGTQMMYYLRMYDQRMNFVSQAVSNGALRLAEKTRPDGKTEYLIESKEGANIGNVVQILRGAQPFIGNAEAVNQAFTTYLAALRADRVGLDKLNFGGSVTQDMLDRTMRLVNGNDKLKDVFEKARREYNTYNRDQIAMVAATGAISKETEAALTRSDDYIPFYRAQNGVVELLIGGEAPMRIGSIADQPYLQELVGGDQPILDFMTSSVQNTNMLVDMALRNLATKNAVFELINLGAAKIVKGKPQGRDVVQFKVDGQDRYAVISSETVTVGGKTFETGVPADILVKGMEGIPTQMPFLFRAMAMPAQLLRKAVTLSPLYMAKQLFRDSLSAPIISGANFTPVLGALRQIGKPSGKTLEERGVTGGQYMTGTTEDITKILRDISEGGPGWMSALSKVEAIGMKADALTRRAQYNSYIEQGMSEMEATLMALESMNFNKRGASPSIHVANALIPFFNAQIQGLNVLYKAMSGQMPFSDKLKIQQKLLMRGGMMAAASLLYAALMDDDEAYQNAPPDQKYANWFVRVPGVDQPIRVPIPFEIGYIFKALPEALYNSMTSKQGGEDAVKAFKQILLQTIPGGSSYGIPQIMKPAIEAGLGKSFYTGRDILSAREKELLPEDQFRANTAEISKIVGKSLGISPIVMENLVRGYTGTMGLAFLHALSLGAPKSESPEAAVKRLSDYPIIGGAFQPNDAGGITNAVYERFNEDIKVRNSYKKMIEEGRSAEANELLQRRGNEIMEAEIADVFKQNMNKLTQAERAIAASTMTPEQKREQLDNIRKLKTAISRTMRETADKTVKLSSPL
jgi:hypothetical protein